MCVQDAYGAYEQHFKDSPPAVLRDCLELVTGVDAISIDEVCVSAFPNVYMDQGPHGRMCGVCMDVCMVVCMLLWMYVATSASLCGCMMCGCMFSHISASSLPRCVCTHLRMRTWT